MALLCGEKALLEIISGLLMDMHEFYLLDAHSTSGRLGVARIGQSSKENKGGLEKLMSLQRLWLETMVGFF